MYRNTANNINFHYRTNSVKIKDYFFNKLKKKPVFDPILTHFPNVWSKRNFPEKSGSVTHIVVWVSTVIPKI